MHGDIKNIDPSQIKLFVRLLFSKYASERDNPQSLANAATILAIGDTLLFMMGEAEGCFGTRLTATSISDIHARFIRGLNTSELLKKLAYEYEKLSKDTPNVALFDSSQVNPIYYSVVSDILSNTNIVIVRGGAWSGKTFAIAQALVTIATALKGQVITIVTPSFSHAKRGVMKDIERVCEIAKISYSSNKNEHTYRFLSGSEIHILSTESMSQKIGVKRDILFVNEAVFLDDETFMQLQIRTSKSCILDFNPIDVPSWLRDLDNSSELSDPYRINDDYVPAMKYTKKGKTISRYIVTPLDNKFVQQDVLDRLKSLPEYLRKVFFEGTYIVSSKIDYEAVTKRPDWINTCDTKAIGIDFGFVDPSALVIVYFNKKEREIYGEVLLYKSRASLDEIKTIIDQYSPIPVVTDTSDPVAIKNIQETTKSHIIKKSTISKEFQLYAITQYKIIVQAKSKLHEQVSNLQISSFRPPRHNNHDDDHAIDAFRYAAYYLISQQKLELFTIKANPIIEE